jgi:hypothetical protein
MPVTAIAVSVSIAMPGIATEERTFRHLRERVQLFSRINTFIYSVQKFGLGRRNLYADRIAARGCPAIAAISRLLRALFLVGFNESREAQKRSRNAT